MIFGNIQFFSENLFNQSNFNKNTVKCLIPIYV